MYHHEPRSKEETAATAYQIICDANSTTHIKHIGDKVSEQEMRIELSSNHHHISAADLTYYPLDNIAYFTEKSQRSNHST